MKQIQALDLSVVYQADVPVSPAQAKRLPQLVHIFPQPGSIDRVFVLLVKDQGFVNAVSNKPR